jgi:membrane-bound serine protease (ClpP class)
VLRSRKWKSTTGKEELIGEEGVAITGLAAGVAGMVRIHGELWQAVSEQSAEVGARVRVKKITGLKLYVEPEQASAGAKS